MTVRQVLDFRAGVPWNDRSLEVHRRATTSAWGDPGHPSSEGRRAAIWLDAARATLRDLTGFPNVAFVPNRQVALDAALDALDARALAVPATHLRSVLARAEITVPVDAQGHAQWGEVRNPFDAIAMQLANEETGVLDRPPTGARTVLDASAAFGRMPIPDHVDIVCTDFRAAGSPVDAAVVLSRHPLAIPDSAQVAAVVVAIDAVTSAWSGMLDAALATERAAAAFERTVQERLPDVQFHGTERAPHLRSLSVLHLDAETLMRALDERGWVTGSGSACVRDGEPSHVLAAMGRITHGNLRLALPFGLDLDVLPAFAEDLISTVTRLRIEAGVDDL